MVKLVLLHDADSIYEDEPDFVYDFPRSYLKAVEKDVGDWIVYYEPVKAGPRGYFAVAKIERVIPKPGAEGRFLAMIEPGTLLVFDQEVPRLLDGRPLEAALTAPDGTPKKGGSVQLAVRRLPEADFARIVALGLPQELERIEATATTRSGPSSPKGRACSSAQCWSGSPGGLPRGGVPPEGARGLWLPLRNVRADAAQRRRAA